MPDVVIWQDAGAREALMARGRAAFERIRGDLVEREGIVAVEPESGDYFCAPTLGKANALAGERHPDCWCYFVRIDDPSAEIVLPTW